MQLESTALCSLPTALEKGAGATTIHHLRLKLLLLLPSTSAALICFNGLEGKSRLGTAPLLSVALFSSPISYSFVVLLRAAEAAPALQLVVIGWIDKHHIPSRLRRRTSLKLFCSKT